MIRTLIFLAAAVAHAQTVSFGAKGGVPLDPPDSDWTSKVFESRWTGGPSIELHLPWSLSVEFNALYRTSRVDRLFPLQLAPEQNPFLALSVDRTRIWDFPLLLKHRFLADRNVRPFVSGGASWSYRRSEGSAFYSCLGPQGSCRPPDFPTDFPGGVFESSQTRFGPAGGAGVDFKLKRVILSPELRYHQWSGNRRNAFTALLGLSFGF
jgi:hypothetical protein